MKPAIVESVVVEIIAAVKEACESLREAEARESRMEKSLAEVRDQAGRRRLELGHLLVKARKMWPERGPKAKGWGEFLRLHQLEESTAWRYMQLAGATVPPGISCTTGSVQETSIPTYAELGLDNRPRLSLVPDDAAPEVEPDHLGADRDSWCTPLWIAEAIGKFDLDPCSNARSHINATHAYDKDLRGEDGLDLAHEAPARYRVYLNPPYSDVMPWVEAYKHTRFCFLLKFDPSTKWCELLLSHTAVVLFPRRTRIEFEAPPGVEASSNQFPHGLFYAREDDVSAAIRKHCFEFWRKR